MELLYVLYYSTKQDMLYVLGVFVSPQTITTLIENRENYENQLVARALARKAPEEARGDEERRWRDGQRLLFTRKQTQHLTWERTSGYKERRLHDWLGNVQ